MSRCLCQLALLGLTLAGLAHGQELEPRAYSPAPVGANFLVLAHTRSSGDVLPDPSVVATDVSARLQATSIGFARTFGLLGRASSLAIGLPYASGRLSGNVGEQRASIDRSGLGDARLRLAMNLIGGPALSPAEFASRERGTAVGASLSVVAPTGEYDPARLVNIGTNRWAFKPEIGITREFGRWFAEGSLGVWLFTDNTDFNGGNTRQQDPLSTVQLHGGYNFRPGLWLAADATYYSGGRTSMNGADKQDVQENSRYGLTLSLPIDRGWSAKIAWSKGFLTRAGQDFTTWTVALQYGWFDR